MGTRFISSAIQEYAEQCTTSESPLLGELRQHTVNHVYQPQMLSGHLQGMLLSIISKIIRPQYILEVGTYTGYSALCLAQGLKAHGQLHTIDKNAETNTLAQQYIRKADMDHMITLHLGDAKDIIPTLNCTFDLAFIDADKRGYSQYYHLVKNNMKSGGIILADNVLYSGEVVLPEADRSKYGQALYEFNQEVANDPEVEQILLPIRDGISLIRKL